LVRNWVARCLFAMRVDGMDLEESSDHRQLTARFRPAARTMRTTRATLKNELYLILARHRGLGGACFTGLCPASPPTMFGYRQEQGDIVCQPRLCHP
jgi:hypothetical protein